MKAPDKIYIPTEKLIQEIHRLKDSLDGYSAREALDYIESYINIISQEQPSLPSNLEEAAEEYAFTNWEDNDYHEGASEGMPFDPIGYTEKVFKAGAEWMAMQGSSYNTRVGWIDGPTVLNWPIDILDEFEMDDEVIVQIRQKQ